AARPIHKHDYGGGIGGDNLDTDAEARAVIIVTAIDRGEFKMGSGIRNLAVEIQIRVNGEADQFTGDLLDNLTEKVRLRMMPSPFVSGVNPFREQIFSNGSLKVYGITNQDMTLRTESGLERIRTVPATFICAQVG